jgi:hypothetical protein
MSFIAHMFYGVVPISLHFVEVLLFQRYSGSQKSEVCPMPYALCPMPYALCPMPYALCPSGTSSFARKAILKYIENQDAPEV